MVHCAKNEVNGGKTFNQVTMSWFHQRIQDAFTTTDVVVRTQKTTLSHNIGSCAEFYTRLKEGNLAIAEVVRHLCYKPEAGDEILELTQFS